MRCACVHSHGRCKRSLYLERVDKPRSHESFARKLVGKVQTKLAKCRRKERCVYGPGAPPKAQGAGLAQVAPAELVGLAGRAGAETTPRPRPAFLMRMFRPFTPSALPPVPPPASLGLSTWLPALHQWADTRSAAQVPVESERSQQVHLAFGGPYSPLRWTWRCRVHLAAGASAFHSHARASAPAPAAGAPAACRSCRGQGQATRGLRQGHVTRRAPAGRHQAIWLRVEF